MESEYTKDMHTIVGNEVFGFMERDQVKSIEEKFPDLCSFEDWSRKNFIILHSCHFIAKNSGAAQGSYYLVS